MRFEEDTRYYFCKVCETDTPHTYIPAEHGDRYSRLGGTHITSAITVISTS